MGLFKRAFYSVTRQKTKSLILFLTTLILGLGLIVSFLVISSINSTEEKMYANVNSTVALQSYNEGGFSDEVLNDIASLDYVDYFDFTIEDYNIEIKNTFQYTSFKPTEVPEYSRDLSLEEYQESYRTLKVTGFRGVNNEELLITKMGAGEIIDGRTFTKEELEAGSNVLIITEKFAAANNLKVGDNVSIDIKDLEPATTDSDTMTRDMNKKIDVFTQTKKYKIIGILKMNDFELSASEIAEIEKWTENDPIATEEQLAFRKDSQHNIIYTPYQNIKNINADRATRVTVDDYTNFSEASTPVFMLNSSSDLPAFMEATKAILKEAGYATNDESDTSAELFYDIYSDYQLLESTISMTNTLKNTANISFYTILVLSIIVLALVVTMFLRDRRHELGIYLALGEKKHIVVFQILVETIIITVIGLTLALIIGVLITPGISTSLLQGTQSSNTASGGFNILTWIFPFIPTTDIDSSYIVNNYQVNLGFISVILVYAVGIITVLFASIIPCIYILKLNPKKILM